MVWKVCTAYTYVMIFLLLLIPGMSDMATKAMIEALLPDYAVYIGEIWLFYRRMRKEAEEEESH